MDDLHARIPVNQTASRVLASGTHFIPQGNPSEQCFEIMPQIRPFPYNYKRKLSDISGHKYGKHGNMEVIGLSANNYGRWVVRCVCGRYVLRKRKAIFNPKNQHDRCWECDYLKIIKKRDLFRRTGKYRKEDV